ESVRHCRAYAFWPGTRNQEPRVSLKSGTARGDSSATDSLSDHAGRSSCGRPALRLILVPAGSHRTDTTAGLHLIDALTHIAARLSDRRGRLDERASNSLVLQQLPSAPDSRRLSPDRRRSIRTGSCAADGWQRD